MQRLWNLDRQFLTVTDDVIEEHCTPHGEWRGLVLALETSEERLVAGMMP